MGKLYKTELFINERFIKERVYGHLYLLSYIMISCKRVIMFHKGLYNHTSREKQYIK